MKQHLRRVLAVGLCATVCAAVRAADVPSGLKAGSTIVESARELPVAYDVDVVVVGGSSAAVAAAVGAAEHSAKVFLAAPRHYLGEDICGTLRLWREPGEEVAAPLAARLYPADKPATPLQIKKALDDVLLAAKVEFLFGCFPSDVLTGADGSPCGIVMANRAGRQAVRAKVVVDATPGATVARLAGAKARPWPAGPVLFRRVVIGGKAADAPGVSARKAPMPPVGGNTPGAKKGNVAKTGFEVTEYTLRSPLADGGFAALAEAEQAGRDLTSSADDALPAESMFCVPPDCVECRKGAAAWPGLAAADLGHFQPLGVEHLFVLGGCADVPRDEAEKLLRPAKLIELGSRIGAAAAEAARARPAVECTGLAASSGQSATPLNTKEFLAGVRPMQKLPKLAIGAHALPVWGQYDVVVVGAGTSGWRAAYAAAAEGARTLVVEFQYGTGGVGTLGGIGKDVIARMNQQRAKLRQAKVDIWFGAVGCGAVVQGNRVRGVVVATSQGRGAVLAKVVVDATGNADIAAAAGAECMYTDAGELAVQGAGLTTIEPNPQYANSDFTFTDDTDLVDTWQLLVFTKGRGGYDQGQLLDTRERRRIVGDYVVTILDQVTGRTFPDTIEQCHRGGYDTHGYTSDPYFFVEFLPDSAAVKNTPYRCLLPRGLDGILVTGLGLSAHRDALPFIRWQDDMGRLGQAAGAAAALIAHGGGSTRDLDVRLLQQRLVAAEILTKNVLTEQDSFPVSDQALAAAVKQVVGGQPSAKGAAKQYHGTALLMAHRERAVPLLKRAYAEATTPSDQLVYAHILAVCGDATGLATLAPAVETAAWDKGWNFRGMGQFGPSLSRLDRLIIALGSTRDPRALPVILAKLRLLTPSSELSHHRAVALALATLGERAAAQPLAELLSRPGMTGYAVKTLADTKLEGRRSEALREIMLARALFLLGDHDGVARAVLENYAQDLRGHFARHATAVLASAKQ